MRIELWIILITAFLIYNTYHDGKYTKVLLSYKKYYTMIFYAVLSIGIILLLRKNPNQGKNMLQYANNFVKYMPIDKSSIELFSPIFDMTSKNNNSFMNSYNDSGSGNNNYMTPNQPHQQQDPPLQPGGKGATKRSVSETKKKYVAANQDWKCGHCQSQLDHTFEIDHKIRLEYGGGNDVQNLIALCRNCHGKKTASENM
uniref:HNH nuclease domain-containing protein n=1 Tax=viral metagenome TaxID=1070528 RepID=A0A6C0DGA8_9ZZZZ